MIQNNRMLLGAMLTAMLLISIAFVPAVSAKGANENKGVNNVGDIKYTSAELRNLYSKYNITENDIMFAQDKLPHFREGTVLDGNARVIATETGEAPEGLKEGVDYDIVINISEMIYIEEEAMERYIQKYGVDPANPKVKVLNGIPLPKEEVEKRFKSEKKGSTEMDPLISILGGPSTGPHQINGIIDVHIFEAYDSAHKPTEAYTSQTYDALSRFEPKYGIDMNLIWYFGFWDASNVNVAYDSNAVLTDLENDEKTYLTQDNDLLLGWVKLLDHNGLAEPDGVPYAATVCATTVGIHGVDWPHDSIVQHEISHLFNAPEGGYWAYEHPECIMNYAYAYQGTNIWCNSCASIVSENIWGY